MALLLIDTSTARCAVLVRTGGASLQRIETGVRGQDARLAPMVHDILDEAGLVPTDIERIGVIIGPGAFTGVRIGVAFARGLGLTLGKPVTGINALDVFALGGDAGEYRAGVCDVGRGEIVFRLARSGVLQGKYEIVSVDDAVLQITAFGAGHPVHLAGSAAHQISNDVLCDTGQHDLDLERVATLLHASALPVLDALPWYHRPPDAKLPAKLSGSAIP